MDAALLLLKFRSRSRKELQDRLTRKGISQPEILKVSNYLSSLGYLQDEDFAKEWAYAKKIQGKGLALIRLELRRKGIDSEIIKKTLEDLYQNKEEEMEHLKGIAAKKLQSLSRLPEALAFKKVVECLARKGFQYSRISEALKSIRDTSFPLRSSNGGSSRESKKFL